VSFEADYFSANAEGYAAFRPRYPRSLLALLADLCVRNERAWDCATGSGQAATGLMEHFLQVIATDASAEQIARAPRHERIEYRTARAEESGIEGGSVDCVTVAQALHWFDLPAFYAEAARVLRPDGLLAVWCYATQTVDDPAIDALVHELYEETLGPWWTPERRHVEQGYRSLPFPFPEVPLPPFEIVASLDLARLVGYLCTWSAVGRCREATGRDVVAELAPRLVRAWGDPAVTRRVCWPVHVRAGRAPAAFAQP